jgi:hypothetical protein
MGFGLFSSSGVLGSTGGVIVGVTGGVTGDVSFFPCGGVIGCGFGCAVGCGFAGCVGSGAGAAGLTGTFNTDFTFGTFSGRFSPALDIDGALLGNFSVVVP